MDTSGSTLWAFIAGAPVHRAPRYWTTPAAAPASAPAARLLGGRPNPFNPRTTISFALAEERHVTIAVFDLAGRRIATITDRIYGPGIGSVTWEGRNDAGRAVPSGTYVARMETRDGAQARKISLVR